MAEAISEAARTQALVWLDGIEDSPEAERLTRLVARYLTPAHRDNPGAGCPLPSLSAEISRESAMVRRAYEDELRQVLSLIETGLADEGDEGARSRAMGVLALCVGGMMLARAVDDAEFSDEILHWCRQFAGAQHEGE